MIEKPENIKSYSTLDGKKNLNFDQIRSDFFSFLKSSGELELSIKDNKLLQVAARMFLIRKNYIAPGKQPAGDAREIFDKLIGYISGLKTAPSKMSSDKEFSVFSRKERENMLLGARFLQENEENRAGQTYQESDLE